jgi:hypothetical protein
MHIFLAYEGTTHCQHFKMQISLAYEDTTHCQHFKMHISLAYEDTTHCREGYRIEMIVKPIDAPEWLELLISVLLENNIPFRRIV